MAAESAPTRHGVDRALYALWALFWALMVLVAVEDVRDDRGVRWWEPFVWELSSALVATGWLLLQRRLTRQWSVPLTQPWRWFMRQAAWLPLLALSFVVVAYAIRHGVYALTTETYEHPGWLYLLFYEGVKLLLFSSLWLGIIFGFESFDSWRTEREQLLTLQKHLAESQLAQLKAQLQPHFLFNALNTISSLMQVDVDRADRLLTQLADLLRATLQTSLRHTSSLREELELLHLYARIMEQRFEGRVSMSWRVCDDTLGAAIPTLLLQPLLENAYKHGVERNTQATAIELDAQREGDRLLVTLRNVGTLNGTTEGIGLRNCRERLAVLHGDAACFTLSQDTGHVVACVSLPWEEYRA